MVETINIDLSGLKSQFPSISDADVDKLTQICVEEVTAKVYSTWESLAKQRLKSTVPIYLQGLHQVDKGRFSKQIVLTGTLPQMIEEGASPFDLKEGFKKSKKVKFTVPKYNAKGKMVYKGGDWFLTIPFRQGTPGIVGQSGFANEMPQEIYNIILRKPARTPLTASEIPDPYNVPRSRAAIVDETTKKVLFDEYQHKSSIYEGLIKKTAAYDKVTQNTYMTFRRAGANSDPLSWIHKGIMAHNLASEAIKSLDVEQIVTNRVTEFLDNLL